MGRRRRRQFESPRRRRGVRRTAGTTLSRERVLRLLGRRGRPTLSPGRLLRELGANRGERRSLTALLRELVEAGRIERIGGRYRLRGSGGRREATPTHPHAGVRHDYVGILASIPRGGAVTPYRDDQVWSLQVPATELAGARDGDVVVAVPERSRRKGTAVARVTEVLGPPGTPEADFRAVAWRHRLPLEFPPAVLAGAEELDARLDPREVARRVDLRGRPFVTIDPITARDHDDAVLAEPTPGGGTRLWVAIADVDHYVAEGSALDAEALRRGNSVYFPDRAIPMLPERLSGDLCSLRPGMERLVLAVELQLDRRGGVVRRSFYPAVIRSRRRLHYEEAAAVMEGRDPGRELSELREPLRHLAEVARRLMRRRFAAGSIDFDLPSAEIVLGDAGHPVDIVEAPRTVAHRAIEEAMLAANRAVAEWLQEAGVPTLYRIHEPPLPGDMEALSDVLEAFGLLQRKRRAELGPHDIARAIQRVADRPEERLVNLVALRSMRQARYAAENEGHFALAFDGYTHFTSPIRRYADLVVHRTLKDFSEARAGVQRRVALRAEHLAGVAGRLSACERVAMEAERESVDLKKCAFMAERVGEEFDGTITGVARHGFYVTLDPFFVEGLVHVSRLPDYVNLDERAYALVASRSGERFRLGDRVRVRVEDVDRVKAWINFSLLARL